MSSRELARFYPETCDTIQYEGDDYGNVPFLNPLTLKRVITAISHKLHPNELARNEKANPVIIGDPKPIPGIRPYFPSLHDALMPTRLVGRQDIGINIFDEPSKTQSIVFHLKSRPLDSIKPDENVLVDYPFWKIATHPAQLLDIHPNCVDHYHKTQGFIFPRGHGAVQALSCRALRFASNDRNRLTIDNDAIQVPVWLLRTITPDVRPILDLYEPSTFPDCHKNHPVIICNGPHFGKFGIVSQIDGKIAHIRLYLDSTPSIQSVIVNELPPDGSDWIQLTELADHFRIRVEIMERIVQSWPLGSRHRDIAFTLCPSGYVIDGWCRRLYRGPYFYRPIIEIIDQFFRDSGDLLEGLRRFSRDESVDLSEFFRGGVPKGIDDFIDRTKKSVFFSGAVLIDEDWITFSQDGLRKIEGVLSGFVKQRKVDCEVTLPLDEIVWPGKPFPTQIFKLGDRVVVIAGSGPAPFGTLATVVGGSRSQGELELITDDTNPLFSYLRKKLTTRRGLTVKKGDVMNLTLRD
jgi:hypothetical protein